MNKKDIEFFQDYLEELFPDAKAELDFKNHFELLIAVVLSAQTTDIAVNKVTPGLFSKYPSAFELAEASYADVESLIKTIGLYKNKAKNIVELSKILVLKHGGIVPNERHYLEALPGVGRKTTNVVLSNAFNIPALAVDTHINRISKRLGLADINDDVYEVEMKLNEIFPRERWLKLHHQLIFFGRYHCKAQKPNCSECKMRPVCPFFNNEILPKM